MQQESAALYAMLSIDNAGLLLPQQDILSLESVMDIQSNSPTKSNQLGSLPFQDQLIPVYGLDQRMTILTERLATRRVCVILEYQEQAFALLCDQMLPLPRDAVMVYQIPVCMRQLDLLITALAIYNQSICYVTSTAVLAEYLEV